MACPNCLGTGKVPASMRLAAKRQRLDLRSTQPQVKCSLCSGTGQKPDWMKK